MTFENFEKNISSTIRERGYNYFQNGYVSNLDEVETDLWVAEVYGNDDYRVEIKTNKKEIKSWLCDCPYDQGPICKHVVATFYAINNSLEKPKTKGKKKSKNKVNEIFSKVSKEDLQQFLQSQFRKNRGLKNLLIAHFAEYLDEDNDTKYRLIVNSIVKAASGRYGFIDYHKAKSIINELYELIDKANELVVKNNIVEALSICKVIIEELPIIICEMDDSGGGVSDVFNNAFETLFSIISKAPPMLKDDLFQYCLAEYPKQKYHDFGFEDEFLQILPQLVSTEEQEEDFFQLIDQQIKIAGKTDYSSYSIVRLINIKIKYLRLAKREEESHALIEANKNHSEFRKILVNNAISNNNFIVAKKLCNEGIVLSKKMQHDRAEIEWYQKLLEISEKEKNTEDIRRYAEHLYFTYSFSSEYYGKIKLTYSKDEWSNKCENIIDKIKGPQQKGGYYKATALADIFVEEKYFERLLKLMEINQKDIHFVNNYSAHLKNLYPAKVLTFYGNEVKKIALNTGRNVYNEMATHLLKMKKIEGGTEKVNTLIKIFREQYKNRRAMKEIFDENFPETIVKPKGSDLQKQINSNLRLL